MNKDYNTRQNGLSLVKRKSGEDKFIMLKAPKNKQDRQKFLLEHLLRMTDSGPSVEEQSVGNPFARINHIATYTYEVDVSSLFISDVEETSSQIRKFVNCIANFNDFSLLATSFDVFFHNHKYEDDCAQSLSAIYEVPTAKVSRKNYTNKYFTEISMLAGHYELLVVGGFILKDGSISPFLGSSIKNIELKEETTVQTRVPAASFAIVPTRRLLNQYMKRHSHEIWEFNCAQSFSKGFYPISIIELMNHDSQKAKPAVVFEDIG